jgi:NADH-quinone oxidoreductase subunit C
MEENKTLEPDFILDKLNVAFSGCILDSQVTYNLLTITVDSEKIFDIIGFLKKDPEMNFVFLTTLCGIHYPEQELQLGVVYHLHNFEKNMRIRLKAFVSINKPELKSITSLFSSANWMERETYDFYGIIFTGHPNLKRILNVDYLDYFPLRKEYPLEDPTRKDKDDRFFGR